MKFLASIYNEKNRNLFLYVSLLSILIGFVSKHYLITEDVFFNTYSEQITYSRAIEIFSVTQKYSWLASFIIPLLILAKTFVIVILLYTGFIFIDKMYSVSFFQLFKVVIVAEFVFVFCNLSKFLIIFLFKDYSSLHEISYYYPLSLATLFNYNEINPVWVFPFQAANLFQIFYILALSFGLKINCNVSKREADKIVLYTYLPGLTIWILLIIFITSK
jgi:hypothetical protein